MVAIETSGLPRERRRIGPAMVFFISVAALVVLLVCGFGIGLWVSEQRVRAELAKIRAAGEPVTPADLEAFYSPPPDSRDATALWMAAADALSAPEYEADSRGFAFLAGESNTDPLDLGDPWPDIRAKELLWKYRDVLADLHAAAAIGGAARYPTRFSEGIAMTLQPQQNFRSAARLLAFESEMNARGGDAQAAVESIRAIFALARSLQLEPLLVSQLIRLALDNAAVQSFERLLAARDVGGDDLARIDDDLAAIDYHESFHSAMLGERVIGVQTFARPGVLGNETPPIAAWSIFRQGDLAVYLQLMEELVTSSTVKDQAALRAAVSKAHDKVTDVTSESSARWRYPMTALLVPSLLPFAEALGRGAARRGIARTAIAVERFHRAHGSLPETLDDLMPGFAPQVCKDPFSGGPLRWRVTDDDYRIYSVGPDGIDQDGSIAEEPGVSGDIVFRVRLRKVVQPISDEKP